jgi:hypothetical protein
MVATFSLSKAEFNADFVESIKRAFKSDRISIIIEDELDETDRILQNKSLYDKILKGSEDITQGKNVVSFEGNEFIEKYGIK